MRATGVEVRVVAPGDFRHFGIAYGDGIVNNLRAAPWKALALPLFFVSFALAARRAARGADVVHAHWLPSALPALVTGKPFVLQLWGSDAALARRVAPLARRLVRRARLVVGASTALADDARRLGARESLVIPSGIRDPGDGRKPRRARRTRCTSADSPRRRASASSPLPPRGSRSSSSATAPCERSSRRRWASFRRESSGPGTSGRRSSSPPRAARDTESHAREAMAYGRPVVATAVGGLVDAVEDGVTGVLVAPRDVVALRSALEALLADRPRRATLGAEGRRRAIEHWDWKPIAAQWVQAYRVAAAR